MAAPITAEEFLDLVHKSGVVEPKRVDAYVQKLRAANALPTEPSKLAGLLVRDGVLTHFQAEQIAQGKWRRFTIGKYKVLERLGSGGMGSVFLCEHKLMRRRVAVKVLPTAKASDPAALDRFYREARAVAALDHPNIVHAYDIDQDEQLHFLVMEYVDGSSLQDIVKKTGPLDVPRACHYIRQAALGLEHAHEAGLVHRDIKPANILVDRTGQVKLLDMGLARFFNDEEDILTKKYDENVLGTADYLAPEQAIDSHSVDIRADIYGLGATFYYLLSGKAPFGEGTVAQKLLWHQTRNPRPVTEARSDIPAGLVGVIDKMMAKDPAQRYSVPGDVAEGLAPFVQGDILPPSEAELPQLSLAASGPGAELPDSATLRAGATQTPAPSPRALQGMGSSGTKSPAPSGTPRSGTARGPGNSGSQRGAPRSGTRPAANRPAPRPAPEPVAAQSAEELGAWEELAADTEDPTAASDTAPVRSSSRRLARTKAERREQHRLKVAIAAVGIPSLLLIVALVWWFFPRSGPSVATGRPRLHVSQEVGKANTYKTVAAALRQAQAGDTIELLDEVHKENLKVDVGVGKARPDITIQAAEGVSVVWTSATKDEHEPLIRLTRAAGYQLKGQRITLDGKGQVRDLVVVTLQAPGLNLEGFTLQGFKHSAVAITNAAGEERRPIRVHDLNVVGAAKERWAVYLDANPALETVPFNDHIDVAGLTVQGLDLASAVKKKDNTVVGSNVTLPGKK